MWLSKRQFVGLSLLIALPGCGFTPAYAPGGGGRALQNTILAAAPRDKPAFDLVERIEERLGPSDSPRYALNYQISLNPIGVAISTSNAITRYNLTGSVKWELADSATGARLTGGTAENFTSYSATGSTVAGLAAEEDASLRLMRILADQIVTQLLATSGQWANAE
ncbi:LPS assembly lipoprotein LptE [Pseudorhodobacter sp.]|uniref:LPS assembly lipoprotein LptE n=1 Tax=Pseudorhodobacter sp. TaxID=1934400 RepID=UPI002649B03C|nr:LPS assembly lipoprotein LptE [Pseudorhodobacter sp.]MDN5787440.1 LPS assembly lipoprotein LptE [Pseudorhodobacter sp.]